MDILKFINLNTLGQRVKFLRQQRKLTQVQLAQRAHVSQQTIHQIEKGIIKMPKPEVMQELAKALDASPSWLAFAEDIQDFGPDEIRLIKAYQALSAEEQQAIRTLLKIKTSDS